MNGERSDKTKMIPLTDDELYFVQSTLLSKMVQLRSELGQGKISPEVIDEELRNLMATNNKLSRYL